MLNIIKTDEPEAIKEFKRKNTPKTWDDYTPDIKQSLKQHILSAEQSHNCAYCEVKISDINNAHIEHIKPKARFMDDFQNYVNLIVSCNTLKQCGNAKGGKYSDLFINPVLENPEDFLSYNLADGKVIPKNTDDYTIKKANETIEILNLNSSKLVNARKHYILGIQYCDESYLDEMIENHDRFCTLIKCFKQQSF